MLKGKNVNDDVLNKINESILLLRADINSFKESTNKRLDEIEKANNARFDRIEKEMKQGFNDVNKRIDYIVKANKLKDLPTK